MAAVPLPQASLPPPLSLFLNRKLTGFEKISLFNANHPKCKLITSLFIGFLASTFLTTRFLGPLNNFKNVTAMFIGTGLISSSTHYVASKLLYSQIKQMQKVFISCWKKFHELKGNDQERMLKSREIITNLAIAIFHLNGINLIDTDQVPYVIEPSKIFKRFIHNIPDNIFKAQPIIEHLMEWDEIVHGIWPNPEINEMEIVSEIDQALDQYVTNATAFPSKSHLDERDNAIAAIKTKYAPLKSTKTPLSQKKIQEALDFFLS